MKNQKRILGGLVAAAAAALLGMAGMMGGASLSAQTAAAPVALPATTAATGVTAVTAKATFAGGCFWCVESDFDKIPGVISTTSGYTGGKTVKPTYEQVSSNSTGHAEAVEVLYDPAKVTYQRLVEYFWHTIDPTVKDQQFCDKGSPYRSAIYPQNDEQLKIAQASRAALEKSKPFKQPIVTEIALATAFYPAEEYHQDYYKKNPVRYKYYRNGCGRDARLTQLWGDKAGH